MSDQRLLALPQNIKSILWDMDGVLIDSIELDFRVCTPLLQRHGKTNATVSAEDVRRNFHLSPDDFWVELLKIAGVTLGADDQKALLEEYEAARREETYKLNPHILDILQAERGRDLKQAVVSNNKQADIIAILKACGIDGFFDVIVGNDIPNVRKKPEPDPYLEAARQLGVDPSDCAVVEDSLAGAQSGSTAGCYVIGVATGGTPAEALAEAGNTAVVYSQFGPISAELNDGVVTDKTIRTQNDFVSHMIEHIAWRMGVSPNVIWFNNDWEALGGCLGETIKSRAAHSAKSAALGMIDDGSAEVSIDLDADAEFVLTATPTIDLDFFLSSRCEQIASGKPLMDLLNGLARGLDARIEIKVWAFEDPHHTWEGVFRAVGICLGRMYMGKNNRDAEALQSPAEPPAPVPTHKQGVGTLSVDELTVTSAAIRRETAESVTRVRIEMSDSPSVNTEIETAPSIRTDGFEDVLAVFGKHAGLSIDLEYKETRLSSSHVVLEDTGIILGRALLRMMIARMEAFGANGAGSSIRTDMDIHSNDPQVGVSVEGRKFLKFASSDDGAGDLRKKLFIGHTIFTALRTEDLDDFLDGLAVGMQCSIMVHLRTIQDPQDTWHAMIARLGAAVRESLEVNQARKNLPPGVKATLI